MNSEEIQPSERIHNFREVVLGYTEEQAQIEAKRCLQCKNPKCVEACPVCIDIPGFIKQIKNKDYDKACNTILQQNPFPKIAGRICPQERLCDRSCFLGKNRKSIGLLERFAREKEQKR
jgi:glutamate synthase (NADPH/NADH) small chain